MSSRAKTQTNTNGCAITARQLVCDNPRTARNLMNEQSDEQQRRQENNEKETSREPLKERQPK
jgi:hypothetical protein